MEQLFSFNQVDNQVGITKNTNGTFDFYFYLTNGEDFTEGRTNLSKEEYDVFLRVFKRLGEVYESSTRVKNN